MTFIRAVLVAATCFFAVATAFAADAATPKKLWVYIGAYSARGSKGIYRAELDLATGELRALKLAAKTKDPSFLAIHPNRRFLYAVGEGAGKAGGLAAFAIDPSTGDLTLLNRQSAGGAGPCHLVTDRQGKHVLVANYGGGSASVLAIEDDGKLGESTAFVQHKGSSVNKSRQEGPHAHSINLDPANRFAFVADLGLDKVLVYRFDNGKLTPNEPPAAVIEPGSGPRHFAFHPTGKFAYVINELKNTVTAFTYDADQGVLKQIQTISTLPSDFKGTSYCAEVVVHPSGKFLYGSNRGHDSIATFSIDQETGKLTAAGHQGEGVKVPRGFTADPTGKYLLVGNQDGDNVIVFKIDPRTGGLTPVGSPVKVAMPVCIRMMAAGR